MPFLLMYSSINLKANKWKISKKFVRDNFFNNFFVKKIVFYFSKLFLFILYQLNFNKTNTIIFITHNVYYT